MALALRPDTMLTWNAFNQAVRGVPDGVMIFRWLPAQFRMDRDLEVVFDAASGTILSTWQVIRDAGGHDVGVEPAKLTHVEQQCMIDACKRRVRAIYCEELLSGACEAYPACAWTGVTGS